MKEAIKGTLDYYINHYPQKRLKGKTCGQVRKEAMATDTYALAFVQKMISLPKPLLV